MAGGEELTKNETGSILLLDYLGYSLIYKQMHLVALEASFDMVVIAIVS